MVGISYSWNPMGKATVSIQIVLRLPNVQHNQLQLASCRSTNHSIGTPATSRSILLQSHLQRMLCCSTLHRSRILPHLWSRGVLQSLFYHNRKTSLK